MKLVTFATAPVGQARETFQRWFAEEYVRSVRKGAPSLCGGVIRRKAEIGNALSFEIPPTDPITGIAPCDVMMELWFPASEDFRREVIPLEERLTTIGSRFISYAVSPRLQKDPRIVEAGPGGTRPALTFVIAVRWLPNITAEFADREWQEHAAVALRTQPAMTKYEQNTVLEVISYTPGTPAINIYADFSFKTAEEMAKGFVFTREEQQDTATFCGMALPQRFGDAEPIGPRL
jgi:hypothetical protein